MTQRERILGFFKSDPSHGHTPRQVHRRLFKGARVPLTSTRRAITDLSLEGELVMLGTMVPETYGRGNHLWIAV